MPGYFSKFMNLSNLNIRFSFFHLFSILLLLYMIWPGPSSIKSFKPLPSSFKSQLEGDTVQIPNVSAYFSNNFRELAVPYYLSNYQNNTHLPFPPLRLNRPPEYSWIAIKKHTDSTYIEELVYPLRDSLYVNGYEPFYSDGTPKFWGSTKFTAGTQDYYTKTTLRFYPSKLIIRILVWLGIVSSIYFLMKLGKETLA